MDRVDTKATELFHFLNHCFIHPSSSEETTTTNDNISKFTKLLLAAKSRVSANYYHCPSSPRFIISLFRWLCTFSWYNFSSEVGENFLEQFILVTRWFVNFPFFIYIFLLFDKSIAFSPDVEFRLSSGPGIFRYR